MSLQQELEAFRDHLLRRMWFGRRKHDRAEVRGKSPATEGSPGKFWHYAPWLVRFILAVPTLLFVRIGWKYVSEPLQVAAGSGMILGSPAAVTDTRAVGALFLAFAALTLISLLVDAAASRGTCLGRDCIGFVTATRVFGVLVDCAASETVFKLIPELALLPLSVEGLALPRMHRAASW